MAAAEAAQRAGTGRIETRAKVSSWTTDRSNRSANRSANRHAHLWQLPDGTGLHAPFGRLTANGSTGELCCHLCGRWFRSLGAHVRVHGYTAEGYREAMGLMRSRALTATDLSQAISRRQADRYRQTPDLRDALAEGHRQARARQSDGHGRTSRSARPEREASRQAELDRGRGTVQARREAQLAQRLASLGITDLGDYLRSAHDAGVSLQTMAGVTGLGRTRLRRALIEAGVDERPPGWNSPAGKRSRALAADAAAARRVGTQDIRAWLRERRAQGWSLAQLGHAVDRSGRWVRWRLDS